MEWLCRRALKSKYLISKFETIPNDTNPTDQNQETPGSLSALPRSVWSLGIFEFRICFGFRYWDFEFVQ